MIQKSGRPKQHLAWSDPAQDRELKKAAQQHRLLTIHQQVRGAKKDHGAVGLESGRNLQYFLFPRSLKSFAGVRVIGIDYGLVDEGLSAAVFNPKHSPVPTKRVARSSRPASEKGENIVHFPEPEPESPPVPKRTRAEPPPEPDTPPSASMADIRREIAKAVRELRAKKYTAARTRLDELLKRVPD